MTTKRKGRKPEIVKIGNVAVKIYRRQKTIKSKRRDGSTAEKDYTVFQVEDYTTGKRSFHDTTKHAKALALAERLAGQISTGQTTAASMTNAQAASYGRAVELLPPGMALEVAAGTVAKCVEILGGDRMIEAATFFKRHGADSVTPRGVPEVVTELIEAKRARGKSARYLGDLSARLSRFAKDYAVDISSVTTADVQRWIDGLKVAPQTAKNFRTLLGTLFNFAESRGYIFKGGNPVEDVEHITANGGAIEIYTPKEIADLLKAASMEFLPVVALGAFAGLRTAEIERLEWKDIDLSGGFIHVSGEKAKTRSRRLVPILPNLAAWLASYANQKGKVWKRTDNDLRDVRAETVKAAATPWKDNGLRHSFISYRLAAIQNAAQVALEAGNSPAVVFRHYRELVKPEAAIAWFAVAPEQPENVVALKTEAAQ